MNKYFFFFNIERCPVMITSGSCAFMFLVFAKCLIYQIWLFWRMFHWLSIKHTLSNVYVFVRSFFLHQSSLILKLSCCSVSVMHIHHIASYRFDFYNCCFCVLLIYCFIHLEKHSLEITH